MIAQIFYPTTKLAMPTGTETIEVNAEIEAFPLAAETKIKKCSK